MSDPTTQIGLQFGQTALTKGTDYVEQNVSQIGRHDMRTLLTLNSSIATLTFLP